MIYPLENKKSSSPSGVAGGLGYFCGICSRFQRNVFAALRVTLEELMKTENLEVKERKFSLNPLLLLLLLFAAPSTAQYGITGDAEVLFSCWYLVLTLSSLTSIFYLKNIILH